VPRLGRRKPLTQPGSRAEAVPAAPGARSTLCQMRSPAPDGLAHRRKPSHHQSSACEPSVDMPSATTNNPEPRGGTILVVDDEAPNRTVLVRMLTREGYNIVTAEDGVAALAAIDRYQPDVILLDVQMPRLDGLSVCRRVKANPATRLTPVVMVTGLHDRENRIAAIDAGADDFLGKPVELEELRARVRSLMRLKRYTNDLESAEEVILSLALTVEARDPYTDGHSQRLAKYAVALGQSLGLGDTELAALDRGGYLHDIGKIGIADAVLYKSGKLDAGEYERMKQHTIIGERLCGRLRSLSLVRPIIRHHHERLDGTGYPDGLQGDAIPLLAQIVGVVDAYDAMTTTRPYRKALPADYAYGELRLDVEKGWRSAALVEPFITLGERGDLVRISDEVQSGTSDGTFG
jgi:putative two-component system response regulator